MEPKLQELKMAHSILLEKYWHLIEILSYHGLFIKLDPDQTTFKEAKGFQKLKWLSDKFDQFLASLFRPKPLVRVFVEGHIRNRLRELRAIYIQQNILLKSEGVHYRTKKWMEEVAEETRKLEETLQYSNTIWEAAISVAGVFIAILSSVLGVESIFDLTPKILNYFKGAAPENALDSFIPFLSVFFIGLCGIGYMTPSYSAKMWLFAVKQEGEKSIFERENDLFLLLNRGKTKNYNLMALISYAAGLLYCALSLLWIYLSKVQSNLLPAIRIITIIAILVFFSLLVAEGNRREISVSAEKYLESWTISRKRRDRSDKKRKKQPSD